MCALDTTIRLFNKPWECISLAHTLGLVFLNMAYLERESAFLGHTIE